MKDLSVTYNLCRANDFGIRLGVSGNLDTSIYKGFVGIPPHSPVARYMRCQSVIKHAREVYGYTEE